MKAKLAPNLAEAKMVIDSTGTIDTHSQGVADYMQIVDLALARVMERCKKNFDANAFVNASEGDWNDDPANFAQDVYNRAVKDISKEIVKELNLVPKGLIS